MMTSTIPNQNRLRDADILQILDYLCREVELSETDKKAAEKKYYSIGEWLNDCDSSLHCFFPHIYVQGSKRLGTTVKPQSQQEHDIDLVCHYRITPSTDPKVIKQLAWDRLGEHKLYREIREEKNRCIRLNYAGQFHMDIMPCIPDDSRRGRAVLVPDKKLDGLKESNPWDYGVWFDEKALIVPLLTRDFEAYLENRKQASVEPLPDDDSFNKAPLRRFIQLLKVHRDHFFMDDSDHAPISVVVTTLAAKCYADVARRSSYDSILDLFETVVVGLDDYILCIPCAEGGMHYEVSNPTNEKENFAERWCDNPSLYRHFLRWQAACQNFISGLRGKYCDGFSNLGSYLQNSTGERLANRAIQEFSKQRYDTTSQGRSFVHSTGIVTTGPLIVGSQKIPRHTNFGKH